MFYLIRHGEPDYSEASTKMYHDIGIELSPLTENGRIQIKKVAEDPRLQNASIIISSPFTRALQTAAILSKELGLDMIVETDLNEWMARKNENAIDVITKSIYYNSNIKLMYVHKVIRNA